MSDTKLGSIITDDNVKRDAIHVAIAPVVAAERLQSGEHIGLLPNGTASAKVDDYQLIGIVDPFLKQSVKKGEKFYICLYQQTIKGMRHHWSHPSFKDEDEKVSIDDETSSEELSSRGWISKYAAGLGLDYDEIMSAAELFLSHDEYLNHGPRFESQWVPEEFWDHYEKITGKRGAGSFFSCSC
jgi:hypothetical protein